MGDGPPARVLAPERIRATFGVDPAIFAGPAGTALPASELTGAAGGG